MKEYKSYKIIGAYDSETTNIINGAKKVAFPILHQLGLINIDIKSITCENVEKETKIHLFRNTVELYQMLEKIVKTNTNFVPVLCCHNLSFDMYGLANFLINYDVKVLAKSQRKPISFTILDSAGEAKLVVWDTLVFSQKSLEYMGSECGYRKLKGDWDYNLIRTPQTPLTTKELDYAKHDIYSLLAWLGYWCRLNPDLNPNELGFKIVSKTGIVRRKRIQRFSKIKGNNLTKNVGKYWSFINAQNAFTTDDELYTCQAATRGGFTFCARNNASKVFDFNSDDKTKIYGFDATSQHPAQMVSHRYPVRFKKASSENLTQAFKNISLVSVDDVLEHYEKPFGVAFYGSFEFVNLRLKKGTPFFNYGIAPLAYARCKEYKINETISEENQQAEEFREFIAEQGYKDSVINPIYSFGKLEKADKAILFITELTAWEICQAYEFDSVKAINGYISLSFDKPSDMSVISVMQFYKAKNAFKIAREKYYNNEQIINADELIKLGIPDFVANGMKNKTIDDGIVESTYLGLKADLNALFGIEACNEYRRDTILSNDGIAYIGDFGIANAPKQSKNFYQMGQRIVGWSRIAQCIVMMLVYPYVDTIINGDTDSIKFVIHDNNLNKVKRALKRYDDAIDTAKKDVYSRVRYCYPELFDELDGIGYYILEFETTKFCAGWNKAYCISEYDKRDKREHIKFTLAGVPTKNINKLADELIKSGYSFGDICDTFLGYNVTYSHDITNLNARSFPEWGELYTNNVTDYLGNMSKVVEPTALCLYPMAKTINDTQNTENSINMYHALINRPSVYTEPIIINRKGIFKIASYIND